MSYNRAPKTEPIVTVKHIPTIPNAMSAVGALLACKGAEHLGSYQGLVATVAGRSLDVLDGPVARATGQTSNFGAVVDAGLDKIATAKILYELVKKDAIPREITALLGASQAVNALATAVTMAKHPGKPIRPTKSGKLALAGETLSMFSYALASAAEHSGHEKVAAYSRAVGAAAFAAALPLATHATYSYVKQVWQ